MNPLAFPIIWLWLAVIAAKWVCLVLLIHRRLAARYLGLTAWLLVGGTQSLWLLHGMLTSRTGYYDRWASSRLFAFALSTVLALDVFYLMVRRFRGRGAHWFMAALGGGFAAMSATAAAVMAQWWAPGWATVSATMILLGRNHALACVLFLGGSRLWLRRFGPQWMPQNVRAHVMIALLLYAAQTVGQGINRAWRTDAGNWVLLGGTLACCLMWTRLRPSGEQWTPPPVPPPNELGRIQKETEALVEEMKGIGRRPPLVKLNDALRRTEAGTASTDLLGSDRRARRSTTPSAAGLANRVKWRAPIRGSARWRQI